MEIRHLTIKTPKDKIILNNLNLTAEKGQLLAIMGPSGSGKTTLLDLLTKNIRSNLSYDGIVNAKGLVKYVSQEDHLHGFYTVRQYIENYILLNYGKLPQGARANIITNVAESTGLMSALNTKVGDVFTKGLSGGQQRRLSIALELVHKPDILVLDEPTSGLDSVSALHILEVLKRLTAEGICVICTLHQPSSQIWGMLDNILLLAKGYTCYQGTTAGALNFFNSLGKKVPTNGFNPADFYIFQINSDFDKKIDPKQINQKFLTWKDPAKTQPQSELDTERALDLKMAALDTSGTIVVGTIGTIAELTGGEEKKAPPPIKVTKRANAFDKWRALAKRNFWNSVKNPGILGIRLVMNIILSFLVGVMYLNLGDSFTHQGIVSRTSLLFYVQAFLVFMSIAVLPFFMIERAIIIKEVRNRLYKPFHYQLARFITALPGVALIALVSTCLVALVANMNGFPVFLLMLFMSLLVAESLCMLVSLIVPYYIASMAIVAGLYGTFMLVQGFLIVRDDIPIYLVWLHYMAFHTYSFQGFMWNEFKGIKQFSSVQFTNGKQVLDFYSMGDVNLWRCVIILLGYCLVLEICIFIVMKVLFRERQITAKSKEKTETTETLESVATIP